MRANTKNKPNTRQGIVTAMMAVGCVIEEGSSKERVAFSYGGMHYLAVHSEEAGYLCVVLLPFCEVSGFPSLAAANEVMNELNAKVKLARVWIDDGDVLASAETLLGSDMTAENAIKTLLLSLQNIYTETRVRQKFSQLQDQQMAKFESGASTEPTSPGDVAVH